jgi:hypothetical protein
MSDRSIATQWRGVYAYDQSFNGLIKGYADTEFEMQLTIGWFGRFTGKVLDSEPGITEPASIQGRFTKSRITFRKMYASFWVTEESGMSTAVPGQPSYILYYAGEFFENRNRIKGIWQIRAETRWINGEQWDFPPTSGTWSAHSCLQ